MKKVFTHIFTFFLTLCLFYTLFASVLSVTVFSKSFLVKSANKSGYYDAAYAQTVANLKTLAPASGVSEEFFNTLVNKTEFYKNAESFMLDSFNGQSLSAKKQQLETELQEEYFNALCEYAKKENFELTEPVKDALMHVSEYCTEYTLESLSGTVTTTFFGLLGKYVRLVSRYLVWGLLALVLLTLVFGLYVYKLDKTRLKSALISTGILLVVPALLAWCSGILNRIAVAGALKVLISLYANAVVITALVLGVILLIVAFSKNIIKFIKKRSC